MKSTTTKNYSGATLQQPTKKQKIQQLQKLTKEAKAIASKLKLDDRIERFPTRKAFITLKDHKPNFGNNPKCRLINPAKSEIGMISKKCLDKINKVIRSKANLHQWRNTSEVISWFKNIPNKYNCKFIKFDIIEFYSSITENLLKKSINFAKEYVNIDDDTINIIMHCRKSVLFGDQSTWTKRNGNLFDVTMGSYYRAEICELVGLYLLHELNKTIKNQHLGLYRDDGSAIINSKSGPIIERIKKNISTIFQNNCLKIATESNLLQTDFLDIILNLITGKY